MLEGPPPGPTADVLKLAGSTAIEEAVAGGVAWLIEKTQHGKSTPPAPIGLYFARLWYFERLYPLIFALAALRAVRARIK
jgi:squalene-hopene/tetraprenyl-beta-curcumene cyclase